MWFFTNFGISLQVICTILITLNSLDRLLFPSNYSPTISAQPGFLYSPFTGRTLATVAEYFQYFVWATWVGEPFQGSLLGNVVVFGEIVCWCGLLFQSKSIHWCEDSTWTVHGALMLYYSKTMTQFVIFGGFTAYMLFEHQPRMWKDIGKVPDCKRIREVPIAPLDDVAKAW